MKTLLAVTTIAITLVGSATAAPAQGPKQQVPTTPSQGGAVPGRDVREPAHPGFGFDGPRHPHFRHPPGPPPMPPNYPPPGAGRFAPPEPPYSPRVRFAPPPFGFFRFIYQR